VGWFGNAAHNLLYLHSGAKLSDWSVLIQVGGTTGSTHRPVKPRGLAADYQWHKLSVHEDRSALQAVVLCRSPVCAPCRGLFLILIAFTRS